MTVGGALLVALVLAVFAYVIADSQRQDRDDVEQRFQDVAEVSAAVTNGIFQISLAGNRQQAATRLGDRTVAPATLEAFAAQSRLAYAEVLDSKGRRLAATSKAPPAGRASSAVRVAIEKGEARFSEVVGQDRSSVIESAVPYPTRFGERIYVGATRTALFADFLASFLGQIPNFAKAESVMIDNHGIVLGGSRLSTPVGDKLGDPELLRAALAHGSGEYGDHRYFASAPIVSSPFRVVLDASQDDLYESLGGSRRTLPWILFAAFGLAALAGLYLLRRATRASAELERRELNERHAVEINDNIIQGLALAKYQLQLGEGEASAAQVSQTLREAQRLVSGLLGDAAVQAGQLRREVAADTGAPPDPPAEEPRS
jgi:hypothetical protein